MGYIVVLEFILTRLRECSDKDRMVLWRDKGDCVETELGRHDGRNDKSGLVIRRKSPRPSLASPEKSGYYTVSHDD